jgi:hypothetical protein
MEIVEHYKIELIEEGTIQVEGDGWTMTDLPYKIIARWEGRSVTYLEDSIKIYPDDDHLTEAGCKGMSHPRIDLRGTTIRKFIVKKIYERHCKKADELNAMMPPMHFYRELAEHEAKV